VLTTSLLPVRALREMVSDFRGVADIPSSLSALWCCVGNTCGQGVIASISPSFLDVNTLLASRRSIQAVALMRSFGASTSARCCAQLHRAPQFRALRLASSLSLVGAIVGEWFRRHHRLAYCCAGMFTENSSRSGRAAGRGARHRLLMRHRPAERRLVFWSAEQ